MREELEEKLFRDFPSFFRDRDNLQISLMGFGFTCGGGWYDLIYQLCSDIKKLVDKDPLLEDFRVEQVKEKLGGLRFYTSPATEEVFLLIQEAERKSYTICEECGREGKLARSRRGWYKTTGITI